MKINSINIGNFGTLQDTAFSFSDGFNIIYGNNEDGKSTIMAFIRLMFYGNSGRSTDINKNPLKKYTPWNGQKMYGSISFEHMGTHYCLERVFKANGVNGSIVLWNIDKGTKERLTEKSEIGERFFGIGNAAFEKSTYINQTGSIENVFAGDKSNELNKRLSSLVTTGDETISADEILLKLENARKKYNSRYKQGILGLNQDKLSRMEQQLQYKIQLEEQKNSLNSEYKNTLSQLKECQTRYNEFKSKRESRLTAKQLDEIQSAIKSKKTIKEMESQIENKKLLLSSPNVDIDEEFLTMCNQRIQEIRLLEKKVEEIKSNTSNQNIPNLDEINTQLESALQKRDEQEKLYSKIDKLETLVSTSNEKLSNIDDFCKSYSINHKPKNNSSNILIIIGILVILLGVVLKFVLSSFFFVISLIGLIIAGYGIFQKATINSGSSDNVLEKYKSQRLETENQLKNYQQQLSSLKTQIESIEEINSVIEELNAEKKTAENFEHKMGNLNTLNAEVFQKTNILLKTFGEYKELNSIKQIENEIKVLKSAMDEINALILKVAAYKSAEKNNFSVYSLAQLIDMKNKLENKFSAEERLQLSKISDEDGDNLAEQVKQLTETSAKQSTELKTRFKETDNISSLENEIHALKNLVEKQLSDYECIKIAEEVINEAKNDIQTGFSPALCKQTASLLSLITNGKYDKVMISDTFDISVFDNSIKSFKEWQYLSSGTQDQIYFAFRLAVSILMSSPDNPLPLFLDDIFMQYDDTRTKQGMEFLNTYQNSTQIFFFTCHRSILEKADNSIKDGQLFKLVNFKKKGTLD